MVGRTELKEELIRKNDRISDLEMQLRMSRDCTVEYRAVVEWLTEERAADHDIMERLQTAYEAKRAKVGRLQADNSALMTEMQAIYDFAQRFMSHDSRCSKEPLHLVRKINDIAEKRAFRKFALHRSSSAEAVQS